MYELGLEELLDSCAVAADASGTYIPARQGSPSSKATVTIEWLKPVCAAVAEVTASPKGCFCVVLMHNTTHR